MLDVDARHPQACPQDNLPIGIAADVFEHFEPADQIVFIEELDAQFGSRDHRPHGDRRRRRLASILGRPGRRHRLRQFAFAQKARRTQTLSGHYEDHEIGSVMANSFIELAASMNRPRRDEESHQRSPATPAYISILFVLEKQKLVGWLRLKDLDRRAGNRDRRRRSWRVAS
ncbi:MAG: hypothetical protein MZU97_25320 [Bacillus subtilis]|nr:hypothetical protein [Bacillus subtilis]